jgi:glycosyltransferase involved in cell wall biosynthesis
MKKISVVIPVYNNESSLETLSNRLIQTIKSYNSNFNFELIFINDGSKDNSLNILRYLQQKIEGIIVIDFSRNFGQVPGILAGWKMATGDAIINISADLQDSPEQISKMLAEWEKGHEIVINYREARNDDVSSALTSKIAYSLLRFSLPSIPPGGFDYALLDRKALNAVNLISEKNRFYQGDILWVGFSIKYLPYIRQKREHGKSGYNFTKRFGYFMSSFFNVSYFPIRLMSLIGFLTATIGFIYSLVILYSYFVHKTPFQGWAPIMMVILLIGGLLMIMLGITGEYIWRIYDEVKNKPNYIIKDIYQQQ